MDNTSKRIYSKAMKLYQEGNIDKALKLCEKGISEDLKNAPIINLKGLLFYIKGDLKGATSLWKINKDVSNDSVAKKYLEDSNGDKEKENLYKQAVKYLKELKLPEAMEILNVCEQSSFNSINVYNALALLYIKKGEYEKAKEYVEKVLLIDKKNKVALENKRMLKKFGVLKYKFPYEKVAVFIFSIIILFGLVWSIKTYIYPFGKIKIGQAYSSYHNKKEAKKQEKIKENKKDDEKENEALEIDKEIEADNIEDKGEDTNDTKEDEKTDENKSFPYEQFKTSLDNKDFNEIYSFVKAWNNKPLTLNEKSLFVKGEALLIDQGGKYFYELGTTYLGEDNKEAINNFLKAYDYSKESYLNPHIIYYLGTLYEKEGNVEEAVKYYDEYINLYEGQGYEDIVLYNMAIIYKDTDNKKSKEYAKKIEDMFQNSIYNNSKIQEILKN
ncbi:tetratricopeptide repeat protein [Clostridium algidicarnis]|uniref:tetratricopeptide repeat protein n=1 Tax=Clostridium algidicarnis TaxID=37659 RepID=UPI001C0BEA92|nr:tetratricopeptide repeat protein [Clostridium algidicarnis]MBU3192520.1 tetratricopeptide repeat protein [Clostridium algidicarnis]